MVKLVRKRFSALICCKFACPPVVAGMKNICHFSTGAQCNGVCECADGLTYVRGRCRKLVNLNESCRDVKAFDCDLR